MNDLERIWNASPEELKAGYTETDEHYTCLCCGKAFEKGVIYPEDGALYEAGRYTRLHIAKEHRSVFEYLLSLDKSVTGLSELQKRLLLLFYEGKSDATVQKELGIGSASTIRNHRFLLRERARRAKVFQAIMQLLQERDKHAATDRGLLLPESKDERHQAASGPHALVIKKYFPYGAEGPLKSLSLPEKHKPIILGELARRFQSGRIYAEAEINQLLAPIFEDYVALRRYLVDHGLLKRLPDGSQYWLNDSLNGGQETNMDRKKELKQLARETKVTAGIFRITNSINGKVFIESTRDLKTINGQRFQLELGSHPNKRLQQEWNEFGQDAFAFEVLEVLERPETGYFDQRDALKKLKEKWLDRLQPFGERGYNGSGGKGEGKQGN